MTGHPPVFIVGVSRSGTSLMRKILNKSSQVALCDENYFLGHLIESEGMRFKFRRFGNLAEDSNVDRLVDFMYSEAFYRYSRLKTLNWQWQWFVTEVPRDVMRTRILASDRTERGLFTLFMDLFAEHQGAVVKGEKTPAHVRYVDLIMEWFPDARVIHMMRDPRAIFVSEVRRRKEKSQSPPYKQLRHVPFLLNLFLLMQITWTWSDSYRRLRKYQEKYGPRYRLMIFEELVADPVGRLQALCRDFGLEFQEGMLDQQVISEGFQSGKAGFDAQAAQRWKSRIPGWVEWWFNRTLGNRMVKLGYRI